MGARAQRRVSGRRRGLVALGLVAAVGLGLTVVLPALQGQSSGPISAAPADASDAAATIEALINDARASNGLNRLTVASDLTAAAAKRAAAMADTGVLSHTPNLGDALCCWTWLGENVGYAYSAQQAHDTFMGSSEHRANILHAPTTDMGVAVVNKNGTLWVAEIFRTRSDAQRTADATQSSRSSSRSQPSSTTSSTLTSASTPVTTTAGRSRTTVVTLADQLRRMRAHLADRIANHGRLDPLRAAMRYQHMLDRVSR